MDVALPTRRATIRLAHAIARALAPGDLIVLGGGLGAGKTFLVRAMLRALGVPDEIPVPSPTFTLMNEYGAECRARVPVLHADLYRLLGASDEDLEHEIAELGIRARRGEGWAAIVEWGDDAFDALGGDGVRITISMERRGPRVAHLAGSGPRGVVLASAIASPTQT
ncbi:MAG: tRNA (adenosine(37)-N6)-threonylcarbamoyltransferase complex ATPase subunit type 1 TsaE [Deltaproteobacteria bacterium]|nr:tRNA (adenosine(37)-N6)-threonylcarbamoyltransferase complex ATPase subunit type 1 TsaE [Deltaproteobacteria bacterium]